MLTDTTPAARKILLLNPGRQRHPIAMSYRLELIPQKEPLLREMQNKLNHRTLTLIQAQTGTPAVKAN